MYFCSSASDGAPAEDDGLSSAWSDAGDTVWDRLADGVWSEISAPRAPPADARERAYASFSSFSAPMAMNDARPHTWPAPVGSRPPSTL